MVSRDLPLVFSTANGSGKYNAEFGWSTSVFHGGCASCISGYGLMCVQIFSLFVSGVVTAGCERGGLYQFHSSRLTSCVSCLCGVERHRPRFYGKKQPRIARMNADKKENKRKINHGFTRMNADKKRKQNTAFSIQHSAFRKKENARRVRGRFSYSLLSE